MFGYGREARNQCTVMSAKWGDFAAMLLAFDHRGGEVKMHDAAVALAAAAQPPPGARSATASAATRVGSLLSGWRDDTDTAANCAAATAAPRDTVAASAPFRPPGGDRRAEVAVPPSAELTRAVEARRRFQSLVVHRVSLLHALALQSLRCAARPLSQTGSKSSLFSTAHSTPPAPCPGSTRQPLHTRRRTMGRDPTPI